MHRNRPMKRVLLSLMLVAAMPVGIFAQGANSVSFYGAQERDRAALLAASELPATGTPTEAQLKAAARKLGDLGLFSEVSYAISPQGVVYTLTPVPAKAMLPVKYANMVWWSDDELDALAAKSVPLYHGLLPANGTLRDTFTEAMIDLVSDKGFAVERGVAVALTKNPSQTVYSVRVTSPAIRVASASFADPPEALKPAIQALTAKVIGESYDAVNTRLVFAKGAADALRDLNYLDARVESFEVGTPVKVGANVNVSVTAKISDGPRYTLQSLTIDGGELVHQADLPKLESFTTGDPWSMALRKLQASIHHTYQQHGYMSAQVDLELVKDTVAKSAKVALHVQPGEVFHVAALNVSGLDDAQRTAFEKAWTMPVGSVYNADVAEQVMKNTPALRGLSGKWQITANETAHTVDLTVSFSPSIRIP